MRELTTTRVQPAVEKLIAEASDCASAAHALENEARERASRRRGDGQSDDLLASAADFLGRASALPALSHSTAQSRLLAAWTDAVSAYLAAGRGPSVRPTLQTEGFEVLEDSTKSLGAALDDAAATRLRAWAAVEALSRALAQDAVAQQERTAADLSAAQAAATALTGQLSDATSSLAALRTEMAAVQVRTAAPPRSYVLCLRCPCARSPPPFP